MSQADVQLQDRMNRHLQDYLKIPKEDRNRTDYEHLVDCLARAAIDYAKQFTEERRTQLRAQRKGVGRG